MAKFVYKFESIKRVKETLEKKVQKEVAVIEIQIDKMMTEYDRLTSEVMESRNKPVYKNITVGELKFKKGYEFCLEKERISILDQINKLKEKRKIKMSELIQKSKEHSIFETLEDNYSENFRNEQNHIEMQVIDEMATQKFVRQNK
jgi:flagellar export protein FliJ